MKTEYAAIYHTISSLIDISDSEWEYYSALFEVRKFRKKQMLVQAGEVCRHIFFVNRGLLRVFFIDSEGEERTFHFTLTHDFSTDYESFLFGTPANYSIEALEDTEVVLMSHHMVNDGDSKLAGGQQLGRLLAEKYFVILSRHIQSVHTLTPMQRYEAMNRQFPGILQRVSQRIVASYLNISPVHLSRLKNPRSKT